MIFPKNLKITTTTTKRIIRDISEKNTEKNYTNILIKALSKALKLTLFMLALF